MEFIELPVFTEAVQEARAEECLRRLQLELLDREIRFGSGHLHSPSGEVVGLELTP
jgi:hypothetical protein